jgi:cytoplasmic iron level regulating protein YaaA (DUF328/UPF0246 family)
MRLFSCFQDFISTLYSLLSTLYSIISINDELHPHRARGRERFLLA